MMEMRREFSTVEELRQWLQSREIDLSAWGRGEAKSVADLWREVVQGESELRDDPLQRRVDVVRVIVRRGGAILIEDQQEFRGGRQRRRGRPPSEKMKPGESYEETALRCLEEELGVAREAVKILPNSYRRKTWEGYSASYPGLCTQYTFHILRAEVEGLPQDGFSTWEKDPGPGEPVARHHWIWR